MLGADEIGRLLAAKSTIRTSLMGRFKPISRYGSSRTRRKPEQLGHCRQLHVEWLKPEVQPVSGASASLMTLTRSSCAA
jgi:hypothetical protein